jgi:D-glycero-D-manno-heptose 1,7-bisphosphate phosphatase
VTPEAAEPVDAVFLDRDGVLNVKVPEGMYITRPDEVVLLPGAAAAVRRLNQAGVPVLLVTNQRSIARGLLTEAGYAAVAARLRALLAAAGARLDAEYVCPHERGTCDCRKPLPGLLRRAAADRPALRLTRCALVGDSESDVAAARAVGAAAVRLAPPGTPTAAESLAPDLSGAVDLLLAGAARQAIGLLHTRANYGR